MTLMRNSVRVWTLGAIAQFLEVHRLRTRLNFERIQDALTRDVDYFEEPADMEGLPVILMTREGFRKTMLEGMTLAGTGDAQRAEELTLALEAAS